MSGENAPGMRSSLPDFNAALKASRFSAADFVEDSILKSSKLQAPTSREVPNFNIQSKSRGAHFGTWTLEISLELGCWCLVLHFPLEYAAFFSHGTSKFNRWQ